MKNFFKKLRRKFYLWLFEKISYPENLPLLFYGTELITEGDLAAVKTPDGDVFGRVTHVSKNKPPTVVIRIYRQAK